MIISEALLKFIEGLEDCLLCRYKDAGGKLSIGIGHLITGKENPGIGAVIDYKHALELLRDDLRIVTETITRCVEIQLLPHEFEALASFIFNIGSHAFERSTLLKKLNLGLKTEAAEEIRRWDKVGNKVLPGLQYRRQKEYNLFVKSIY